MSISNRHLVLDLDSTLIHSTIDSDEIPNLKPYSDPDNISLRSRIYKFNMTDEKSRRNPNSTVWGIFRPGVFEFLAFASKYFAKIHVWSAGKKKYVHSICEILFPNKKPHIIFTYDDCIFKGDNIYKPLKKLWDLVPDAKPENTIVIDDRLDTFSLNIDNGILIPAYEPEIKISEIMKYDDTLEIIKDWLLNFEVIHIPDIRNIDKNIFRHNIWLR